MCGLLCSALKNTQILTTTATSFVMHGLIFLICLVKDPIDPPTYQVELEAKFDNDDILYSVKYCAEAGLIALCPGSHPEQYRVNIRELTPAGHSFLENIRADTNWAKVKSVAKKAGSFSADVIVEIAKSVAVEAAKHFLSST